MDGSEIGSVSAAHVGAFDLAGDYYIGRDDRGNFGLFNNGAIGPARLWARALASNEVAQLAAFGRPGAGVMARDGLVAEYAPAANGAERDNAGWRVPLTPELRSIPQTNFTCEAVFRTADAARAILIGNYGSSPEGSVSTLTSLELGTGNEARFHQWNGAIMQNSTTRSTGGVNFRDGAWHRLAAVRRGGQTELWLDGAQLGAGQAFDPAAGFAFPTNGATHLGLGRDFRSPGLPLNGDLGAARVWLRALEPAELAGLAASNAVPTQRLAAEWLPEARTNSLRDAGFAGGRLLRTFCAGTNTARLVFTGLPPRCKVDVGFRLAQLDSLDPQAEGDRFALRIDGAEALSVGLGPAQGSEPQVGPFALFGTPADPQAFKDTLALGGQDLFSCGLAPDYNEHVYDLSLLEALRGIPHAGGTLTLEFVGVQNTGGENEGFGIDDVRVTAIPPQGTLISVR
jgi:hypothetical protein